MTRKTYLDSLFTDYHRIHSESQTPVVMNLEALCEAIDELAITLRPLCWIFHSANCGSTLLSRALDLPGKTIGYREPYPLRQLGVEFASFPDEHTDLNAWNRRLRLVLALLGRRYSDVEIPIIKANIPVNFILPELLEMLPDFRGVLLFSDLESFLVSALKSSERRRWIHRVSNELSGAIESMLGWQITECNSVSIPKAAASLWLAQMRKYHDASNHFEGLKGLSSDQFFRHPRETLARAAMHFGVDLSSSELDDIVCGDLFVRYSKNPNVEYNSETRQSEFDYMKKLHALDVSEGMQWAEELMEEHNIVDHLTDMLI